ncbi:MAG: TRAFs-binding domain-containing protein [Bacteroidetes bacterium]|nr:TRAFs-binding domain-containing protein [Bacteroidota bacterium]
MAKKEAKTGTPLNDLIDGKSFRNSVAHERTDIFREMVMYNESIKNDLARARQLSDEDPVRMKSLRIEAIGGVISKFGPAGSMETAALIDIMLSYRNIEAFNEMVDFIRQMPRDVFETVMVQEQFAFVLNRNGNKADPVDEGMIRQAEEALRKVEKWGKASSETYGIWGRIHKDRFDKAWLAGREDEARVHLKNALKCYKKGFESDPRDAYPGVNYISCLELSGERELALRFLPAVESAVKAKMKRKTPDYWDYATLLELAVIENNLAEAQKSLRKAKPLAVESWMLATTRANLERIINFRKSRGEAPGPFMITNL